MFSKLSKLTALSALFLSFSSSSFAASYVVGLLGDLIPDTQKVTHVLVPGTAQKEDSDQFFQSALVRGYKYKEVWPDHQVLIISSPDVVDTKNRSVFQKYGVTILKEPHDKLTTGALVGEMLPFKKIASFDFFGHSSPWVMRLDQRKGNMVPSSQRSILARLIPNFTKDAYATILSCNGGFELAPDLSEVWQIPVSGALTGSYFERLQSDGMWYKKPDRTRSSYVTTNSFSFNQILPCGKGVCWRMKPQRNNYSSYWGTFKEGGLSFAKFFCRFDDQKRCERAMAMSIFTNPSVRSIDIDSPFEDYEEVLMDHLCSTSKDPMYFENCVKGLKAAVLTEDGVFKGHSGNALNCDFNGCEAKIVCKYRRIFGRGPKPGTCHLSLVPNKRPTTIVREYKAFVRGFNALKNN